MKRTAPAFLASFGFAIILPTIAFAAASDINQETGTASWRAQKCAVYQEARAEIFDEIPRGALSPEFAKAEEDYIANGCSGRAYACPQSKAELKYANQMSLAMMSHGLTGTFLPYGCKSGIE